MPQTPLADVYLEQESTVDAPASPETIRFPQQASETPSSSSWPAVERCDWVFQGAPAHKSATYGRVTSSSTAPRARRRM